MNIPEAYLLATELMTKNKLLEEGWRFKWDHAKKRFGYCAYGPKTISLSSPLTHLNNKEVVRNVILHEIAHALTVGANHNKRWKAKCLAIGGDGLRHYGQEVITPPRRYQANCSCGNVYKRQRTPRGVHSCHECHRILVWENGLKQAKTFTNKTKSGKI